MVRCESRPSTIGHITLGTKQTGAPSAGNPHAGCDVAGAGNGFTVRLLRHSQRKRGATARPGLRNTAPVLDPTSSKLIFQPRQRYHGAALEIACGNLRVKCTITKSLRKQALVCTITGLHCGPN